MAKKGATTAAKTEVEETTKEVAVAAPQEKALATQTKAEDVAAWGTSDVSSKDIIIPAIYLMQPMSDKVTNGEAKFGELVESLSDQVLGSFEKTLKVIPFHMEKLFVEYDATNPKKKEYLRTYAITRENEGLPYEDQGVDREGKKCPITRDYCMRFFVLLPSELESGGAIPYTITFRRSSLKAGKQMATQMFVKNMAARKSPAAVVMEISVTKETNDEGTYAILGTKPVGPSEAKHINEAFTWFGIVKAGGAKVTQDTGDVASASEGTAQQEFSGKEQPSSNGEPARF